MCFCFTLLHHLCPSDTVALYECPEVVKRAMLPCHVVYDLRHACLQISLTGLTRLHGWMLRIWKRYAGRKPECSLSC
jgi:hypothetical protein